MLCTHAIELILMLLMFDYQGMLHNDSKKHQTISYIGSPCNEVEVDEGCVSEGDTPAGSAWMML